MGDEECCATPSVSSRCRQSCTSLVLGGVTDGINWKVTKYLIIINSVKGIRTRAKKAQGGQDGEKSEEGAKQDGVVIYSCYFSPNYKVYQWT